MKIVKTAVAGSLESNDVLVSVYPNDQADVKIELESIVKKQFGERIIQCAEEIIKQFNVTGAIIKLDDKGALDYTIKARVEVAILRAGEESEI